MSGVRVIRLYEGEVGVIHLCEGNVAAIGERGEGDSTVCCLLGF